VDWVRRQNAAGKDGDAKETVPGFIPTRGDSEKSIPRYRAFN
jgi:hypothetical protein